MTATLETPLAQPEVLHADGRTVHKGLALVVIAISQLMVVLDATIVNVAFPDIGKALRWSAPATCSGSSPATP